MPRRSEACRPLRRSGLAGRRRQCEARRRAPPVRDSPGAGRGRDCEALRWRRADRCSGSAGGGRGSGARRVRPGSTVRSWCAERRRQCEARQGQTVGSSLAVRGRESATLRAPPGSTVRSWYAVRGRACEARRGQTVRSSFAERGRECAARQMPGRRLRSTCEALSPGTEESPRRVGSAQQASTGRSSCAGRGRDCAARPGRTARWWCAERGRAFSARLRRAAIRPDSTGGPQAAERGRECAAWRTPGSRSGSTCGVLRPGSEESPLPARTPRGSRNRSWCAERGRGCVARCRGWRDRSRRAAGGAQACRARPGQQVLEVSPALCHLERRSTLGGATRASSSSGSSREVCRLRCPDCSSGRSRASSGGGWARRMTGPTAEAVPGLLRRRVPRSHPEAVLGRG